MNNFDKSNVNTTDYSERVLNFIERHPEAKDAVDQIHTYIMVIMQGEFRPFPFVSTLVQCYNVHVGDITNMGFDVDFDDEDPDFLYVETYVNECTRFHNTDTAHKFTLENFLKLLSGEKAPDVNNELVALETCVTPLDPYQG